MRKLSNNTGHLTDPDDGKLRQTIAVKLLQGKTISGYGRSQHGLNGKDADLDSIGQCVVNYLSVYDDRKGTWLEAEIQQYASVCPARDEESEARDEQLMAESEALALGCDEFTGEWSDDYWVFTNSPVNARCKITEQEYENDGASEFFLQRIATRLVRAINKVASVRAFEDRMNQLNADMNGLHKDVRRRMVQ